MEMRSFEEFLAKAGCNVARQSLPLLQSQLSVEPPIVLTKQFRSDLPVHIGAFSKIHGPGLMAWTKVGRFTSIAPHAVLGGNEHAIDWLSTSAVFEAPQMHGWDSLLSSTNSPRKFEFSGAVKCVSVGHDVWIADGAFIRGGVTIGDGAVVGARAVVLSDVPPYAVVAGNPAKVIRMRFDDVTVEKLCAFQWWRFDFAAVSQADIRDPRAAVAQLEDLEASGKIAEYSPGYVNAGRFR
ncbi:CatB-related O-acetyltransferase [Methylobacterium sp. V23]|uniref:CatB-related O-acetyltransferase n=1 Tax=Methylobacterium sp. V23 TaxID=2044878 RepID=UPI0015E19FD2|nr:CatB-related O-acetyltransferase [Methylobacterium sp. V23]